MSNARGAQSANRRDPWYEDLLYGTPLPENGRSISAYRGTLPQFKNLLLTLRIIHLFPFQEKANSPKIDNEPVPWHFPGLEDSTHHLFLHTRLIPPYPQNWVDSSLLDTTLSMQFTIYGDPDWLRIGSLYPDYQPLDQSRVLLPQYQKAANLLAEQIGFYLVSRFMPSLQEQWLVERHIDPASRKEGRQPRMMEIEKTAERYRLAEWGGRMDYVHTKLIERYQKILSD